MNLGPLDHESDILPMSYWNMLKDDTILYTFILAIAWSLQENICHLDRELNPRPLEHEGDTLPMSYWNLMKVALLGLFLLLGQQATKYEHEKYSFFWYGL